jgi:purine-nucleoside phosphorylase
MSDLLKKITEAADFIRSKTQLKADRAIVLGTGLGSVVDQIVDGIIIPYQDIPHFPDTTVVTHQGNLHIGMLKESNVIALAGRFHYYEGYTMEEICFPIRVLNALGVQKILITNISGGLSPDYKAGDLVLVNDHINLLANNPLRGKNYDELGPRFPDMIDAYDPAWLEATRKLCLDLGLKINEGVYAALQGPSLETKAEYRFLHKIGADMVGMSSVPEAIVARHMNMKVLMISMISNVCYPPENIKETNADEIVQTALSNVWKLKKLSVEAIHL